jgi:hypothetical protein
VAKCFGKTAFVDNEKLFEVDDEGYNREVLKLTKTNEDLQILQSTSGMSSPNKGGRDRSESRKKSPSKKKKGKKGSRVSKFVGIQEVQAETFDILEK